MRLSNAISSKTSALHNWSIKHESVTLFKCMDVTRPKVTWSAANEAQLIDLSCNGTLKGKLSESSLSILWLNVASVFPELSCQFCCHFQPLTCLKLEFDHWHQ